MITHTPSRRMESMGEDNVGALPVVPPQQQPHKSSRQSQPYNRYRRHYRRWAVLVLVLATWCSSGIHSRSSSHSSSSSSRRGGGSLWQLPTTAAAEARPESPMVFFTNPVTQRLARASGDRALEDVAKGSIDRPITGLAVDSAEGRVYWSDGASIMRSDLEGNDVTTVVPALYLYIIGGVNFGASANELVTIELHGTACTSVHYWSSTLVGCVTADPAHNEEETAGTVTVYDVGIVSTRGGHSGPATEDAAYAVRRAGEGYNTPMVSSVRRVSRIGAVRALAFDDLTSQLFWSDAATGTIHRADANGRYVSLLATGLFEVYGLATNAASLYYTDHNAGRVVHVNLTAAGDMYDDPALAGVAVERVTDVATGGVITSVGTSDRDLASVTLLAGFRQLRGIALDVPNAMMYLTEASGRLFRARMDGRNMQRNPRKRAMYAQLLVKRPSSARLDGIAVTQGAAGANPHRIFWTEANSNAVYSCDIWGSDMQRLAGANGRMVWPRAIALLRQEGSSYTDEHLFWSQYLGRIRRAATTGGVDRTIVDYVQPSSGFEAVEQDVIRWQAAGRSLLFNVD